jgi:PqqD family protein of HPr-rel-A system
MVDTLISAAPPEQIRIVSFDGLTAIYHRRSGQTHIVSEPLPEILWALGNGPLTLDALLARLSIDAAIRAEGDPAEELTARIAELEAVGLVVFA